MHHIPAPTPGWVRRTRRAGRDAALRRLLTLEGRTIAGRCPSLALEQRLALLIEGADALVAVSRADQPIIGLDLEEEAVLQIHLQTVMDRSLGLADRERRIGADRRRRRQHPR